MAVARRILLDINRDAGSAGGHPDRAIRGRARSGRRRVNLSQQRGVAASTNRRSDPPGDDKLEAPQAMRPNSDAVVKLFKHQIDG